MHPFVIPYSAFATPWRWAGPLISSLSLQTWRQFRKRLVICPGSHSWKRWDSTTGQWCLSWQSMSSSAGWSPDRYLSVKPRRDSLTRRTTPAASPTPTSSRSSAKWCECESPWAELNPTWLCCLPAADLGSCKQLSFFVCKMRLLMTMLLIPSQGSHED